LIAFIYIKKIVEIVELKNNKPLKIYK